MLVPPGRQGGQLGWVPPGVLPAPHIQAGSPKAQPWYWSWETGALAASLLPPGLPLDMRRLQYPYSPCMGTESAKKQETCWVSAQTRHVGTSLHAHEQQEGVREVTPCLLLDGQGAKGTLGETLPGRHPALGSPAAAAPTQPLPLSSSSRERRRTVRTANSPLHRGTPSLSHLTMSLLPKPPPQAGTFCCPLHEGPVPLLGSQGRSPLLSCALPFSPAHLLVPAAQRFPFLLGQHKAYTCFVPGLALITSHKWWDQIQECSAWILPNT